MPLTRNFKETIRDRVQRDSNLRKELLREGLEAMLSGKIQSRQDNFARLHQRNGWIRRPRRGYAYSTQKPHAHVRPSRQPARGQPV